MSPVSTSVLPLVLADPEQTRLFHGSIISPVSIHEAQYLERALLAVSSEGIIEWLEHDVDPTQLQDVALKHGMVLDGSVDVHELKYGEWLMPGFVDTHTVSITHALPISLTYSRDIARTPVS
jgi:cytosine/adenosine deaminase-related metal-dependent hydrolase